MLGRGLNSLIPTSKGKIREETAKEIVEEIKEAGEKILNISLEEIEPNPYQPRKSFSHLELEELINSIKEYGIIEPLILTPFDSRFQIIAGERRFRAAQILGLKTVPAVIRKASEIEKLEISLLENLQRKDLNPMERARAYQRLIDEFNLKEEEISRKLGKARSTIANSLRLLSLPVSVQKAIEEEKISEGHAKALASSEDSEKQEKFLRRILGLGLTVRETEKAISGKRVYKKIELDPLILAQEEELAHRLDARVEIKKTRKKRKIIIEVNDDEELDNLIKKLLD